MRTFLLSLTTLVPALLALLAPPATEPQPQIAVTHKMSIVKARYAVTACLVLLAMLLWRLAGDFRTPDPRSCAPVLDSFSEPSVCLARLKQEAEVLMLAYTKNRDEEENPQPGPSQDGTRPTGGFRGQALANLHAGVQDLEVDLDRKLLVPYYQNGSWNEFVDCYLRLIQQTPERPVGEAMAWSALTCAQKCGRIEEVTDAMYHVVRFHPNLQSAQALRMALDRWEKQHLINPGVNQR